MPRSPRDRRRQRVRPPAGEKPGRPHHHRHRRIRRGSTKESMQEYQTHAHRNAARAHALTPAAEIGQPGARLGIHSYICATERARFAGRRTRAPREVSVFSPGPRACLSTHRREFPAKVIGSDTRSDVAVIKIDARDLPVVSIGDDKELQIGEWVLAIGAPFGLENTATAGIVSGTSRAISGESTVPFIQTDVAVNPGNSGGPLFNLSGPGRRHQLHDLQPERRLHGYLVRDSHRRGHGRARAIDQDRARGTRPHWRGGAGRRCLAGQVLQARSPARRADQRRYWGQTPFASKMCQT